MVDLWLSIGCSSLIYVIFKLIGNLRADNLNAIVYNYITATALGIYFYQSAIDINFVVNAPWFPHAIGIGCLFIGMFFLIGAATQKIGISITSLSSKISMIIPVLYSILVWGEEYSTVKIVGIAMALLSVVLATIRQVDPNKKWLTILPAIIFVGMGCIDTLISYTQRNFLDENSNAVFSATLFATAALAGFIVLLIKKPKIRTLVSAPTILGGVALGVVNFGSLYFIIRALANPELETSVIFGLNNMCIVAVSSIIGAFLFKESLSRLNWIGVVLAFISIFILSYV